MADTPKNPKEVDVFNRFTKFNKLKAILITLGIALVSFVALYCFIKSLMPYTITIIPDGGLVFGQEIESTTYRLWERTIEPVGFKKEGYYVLFEYEANASVPQKISALMNIDENVLRSLCLKKDEKDAK